MKKWNWRVFCTECQQRHLGDDFQNSVVFSLSFAQRFHMQAQANQVHLAHLPSRAGFQIWTMHSSSNKQFTECMCHTTCLAFVGFELSVLPLCLAWSLTCLLFAVAHVLNCNFLQWKFNDFLVVRASCRAVCKPFSKSGLNVAAVQTDSGFFVCFLLWFPMWDDDIVNPFCSNFLKGYIWEARPWPMLLPSHGLCLDRRWPNFFLLMFDHGHDKPQQTKPMPLHISVSRNMLC